MNPQDPLAALAPLRDPALIGWWPPAPGWWILGALLLTVLGYLTFLGIRRYRARHYRRLALAQLRQLEQDYQQDKDLSRYLIAINRLLKTVAIRSYGHRTVSSLSGDRWAEFLNAELSAPHLFDPALASASYQTMPPDLSPSKIQSSAIHWINKHGAPT